jgi:hypothetical protein
VALTRRIPSQEVTISVFQGPHSGCKLLLVNGADQRCRRSVLGSSYPKAVKGHLKTVDLLLENGTDVNAKGQSFGTAL